MMAMARARRGLSPLTGWKAAAAFAVLGLYAFALLSIGLTRDWRLRHEDNGAFHTTLALSHVHLGLAKTRAHAVFYRPDTGQTRLYGHHPPAPALILAGAFVLTGSTAPWVARSVAVAFHLGSLIVLLLLLSRHVSTSAVWLGGLLMATLPMSAYFGRMMNYEPLCLFAMLLQLAGYAAFKHRGSRCGLALLAAAICLGGLMDWGAFFFTAMIALVAAFDWRRRAGSAALLAVATISTVAIFGFDLLHLWYAGHGSLRPLQGVLSHNLSGEQLAGKQTLRVMPFVLGQLEIFRRYYTHAGLLASILVACCLVCPHTSLARALLTARADALLKRLLIIAGGGALGYVLAAPAWAAVHHYWQFYFLPFVVMSMLLVGRALWRQVAATQARALRALAVVCVLDVMLTSSYTLYLRHTKIEAYAVRTTAALRSQYLSGADLPHR